MIIILMPYQLVLAPLVVLSTSWVRVGPGGLRRLLTLMPGGAAWNPAMRLFIVMRLCRRPGIQFVVSGDHNRLASKKEGLNLRLP